MIDILFILPVGGGSGGAHSVMQEADAMRRLGADARVAVNKDNAGRLQQAYQDLPAINGHILPYAGTEGLAALLAGLTPRATVATTNQSVHVLAQALVEGELGQLRTAYYIQDYEPLFYPRQSDDWLTARASYGLIPGMVHFAKTGWLQEVVRDNHHIDVFRVEPSIDHGAFFPDLARVFAAEAPLTLTAMVRPSTPRRAPQRTVRILNRLAEEFAGTLECSAFGCSIDEMRAHGLALAGVEQIGPLSRAGVGELLRRTDIFLDLSDFQAFGRTALEAMSCGAVTVAPAHGGTSEFAIDGHNALVVDTRSDENIVAAVSSITGMTPEERHSIRLSGIATGYRYSPEAAALSELRLLLGI
jgi:glycosyltransferase involved in cell wall biosynthesis